MGLHLLSCSLTAIRFLHLPVLKAVINEYWQYIYQSEFKRRERDKKKKGLFMLPTCLFVCVLWISMPTTFYVLNQYNCTDQLSRYWCLLVDKHQTCTASVSGVLAGPSVCTVVHSFCTTAAIQGVSKPQPTTDNNHKWKPVRHFIPFCPPNGTSSPVWCQISN